MWLHRRAAHLLLLLLPVAGGLLPSRGEAAGGTVPGLPCGTPRLVKDLVNGATGSVPSNLVDVNGTLYFTASTGPGSSDELWKKAGADPERVQDASAWPSASLSQLTGVGNKLYFVTSLGGVRLWVLDGPQAVPQVLKGFPAQSVDPNLVSWNNKLYFSAYDGPDDGNTHGVELWESNGTVAETRLVRDISPSGDSSPSELTLFQGKLVFVAQDDVSGTELWVVDQLGVRLAADINRNAGDGNPKHLTVVGDWLYFFAADGTGNNKLWRLRWPEGERDPTLELVPSELSEETYSDHGDALIAVAGNKLFFTVTELVRGTQLWVHEGTSTRHVMDLMVATTAQFPTFAVIGETLFFTVVDQNLDYELWRSDGTQAGTARVPNFLPKSDETLTVRAGLGVLLVEAKDRQWGKELWKIDRTGAYRVTDISPGSASSLTRGVQAISGQNLFFSANDPSFGEELFVLSLKEVDCFAPRLTCPGDQEVEALSDEGTRFISPPAEVFDDAIVGLTFGHTPALAGTFPLGPTQITATARDPAGHEATCSFDVNVVDRTPPLLVCPTEVRQEASSPAGARVDYSYGVSDAVTSPVPVSFATTPASATDVRPGSFFPYGETTVTITAADNRNINPEHNRTSLCTFKVRVEDTRGPRMTCPEDVVLIATSADPVPVSYEVFPVDVHPVKSVSYSHPSGSAFPFGTTTVTVEATDAKDNTSRCSFQVIHVDPEGPTIACPGPQQAVATEPEGVSVDFPAATAEDNLAPPALSYSHEPGSTFPVGETIVTAQARDLGGNTATCTFPVTVVAGEESSSGCGCGAGQSGGSLGWLMLALTTLWARRRAGRVGR